jgi:hypothetical protein
MVVNGNDEHQQAGQQLTANLTKELDKLDAIRKQAGQSTFNGQPPQNYLDAAKQQVLDQWDQWDKSPSYAGIGHVSSWQGMNRRINDSGYIKKLFNDPTFDPNLQKTMQINIKSLALANLINDLQKNPTGTATNNSADLENFGQGQPTTVAANNPQTVNTPAINPMRTNVTSNDNGNI